MSCTCLSLLCPATYTSFRFNVDHIHDDGDDDDDYCRDKIIEVSQYSADPRALDSTEHRADRPDDQHHRVRPQAARGPSQVGGKEEAKTFPSVSRDRNFSALWRAVKMQAVLRAAKRRREKRERRPRRSRRSR